MKHNVKNILDSYIDLMIIREMKIEKNLFRENKFIDMYNHFTDSLYIYTPYIPVLDMSSKKISYEKPQNEIGSRYSVEKIIDAYYGKINGNGLQ